MLRIVAVLFGGLLIVTGTLLAQSAPSFEPASVKPNVSGGLDAGWQSPPGGGRVVIRNLPLRTIWTPDQLPPAASPDRIAVGGVEIDLTGGVNVDPNGAALLTALREQLGLELESARGPVDVFVIDRVERPTPD